MSGPCDRILTPAAGPATGELTPLAIARFNSEGVGSWPPSRQTVTQRTTPSAKQDGIWPHSTVRWMGIANKWSGCAHPVRLPLQRHPARRIVSRGYRHNRPRTFGSSLMPARPAIRRTRTLLLP